ncbi:hypothetical protein D3C71_1707770 [compost metagenome]|jgi:hypothetical protein
MAQRSKNLDDQLILQIVEILDGWSDDLTWEGLVEVVDRRIGQRYTRQALHKHERIKQAFTLRKVALGSERGKVRKVTDPVLQLTLDRLARIEAENERLKRENANLLEQFVRWTYNAGLKGLTLDLLNQPLPAIHRGQTDRGIRRVR